MHSFPNFDGQVVRPIFFLFLDLVSGPFRVNSSDRNILIGADTFYGIGKLGKISDTQTTTGTQSPVCKLTLQGVDQAYAINVSQENVRDRPGTLYIGLADAGNQLYFPPFKYFAGCWIPCLCNSGRPLPFRLR
jgi:hypothetical protein